MKKMKRNFLTAILSFCMMACLSVAAIIATPVKKASAESELTMVGAYLRLEDNVYGIRFEAQIAEIKEEADYYVIIIPEEWREHLTGDDYYQELVDAGKTPGEDFICLHSAPQKTDDGYAIRGSIANLKYKNTNRQFFGVVYEEITTTTIDEETQEEVVTITRTYATNQEKGVRSICWIAGAGLNDGLTDSRLMETVNKAYNVSLGKAETDTQATLDLSAIYFANNAYYTLDKGSQTTLEMVGLPEIDLPIKYWVQAGNGTPSTITEDGVLTVNDETGYSFVRAQIAGETKLLTVYNTPQMAEGMLNDFAGNTSGRTYDMNIYGTDIAGGRGYWLNEKADAYGNKGYGVGSVAKGSEASGLRLNVSKAELKAMDIETITVRFLVEVTDASVQNLSLNFFWIPEISNPGAIYKSYPVNTWSYYTINKPADESAWQTFMDTYCNTGVGRTAWNQGGFQVYSGNPTLYIDYISVGTIRMENHELENFNTSAAAYNHIGDLINNGTKTGTYTASKADGTGTTAYGVVSAQMWYSNGTMATRFGRTEAELLKIMENLDTLTVRLLITRADSDTEWHFKVFGVQKLIPTNTWYDFTVTREQILNAITGETEEAKIAKFASNFSSTGTAASPRMLGSACSGTSIMVYLDSITYTVNTAE